MTSTSNEHFRPLSYHERYCLSRHLIGYPPILTIVARVSQTPRDPIVRVRESVMRLLHSQPWLCSTIDQSHFPPRWTSNTELKINEIVHERSGPVDFEQLLQSGSRPDVRLNIRNGPLWCLDVTSDEFGTAYFALSVHHALCDGLGARNILGRILSEMTGDGSLDESRTMIPPALETSMDIRPSWAQFFGALFNNIVLPLLPAVLRPAPITMWPNPVRPRNNPKIHVISLDASALASIKDHARDHGVRTLHPVIYAAAVSSLRSLVTDSLEDEKVVGIDTPMSLRDPALGHPLIGGNYVANFKRVLRDRVNGTFWQLARDYADEISDPSMRRRAIGEAGMLAYMPSSPPRQVPGSEHPKQSGWERMFRKQLESDHPYRTSVVLTNIGSLSLSNTRAHPSQTTPSPVEVAWAQTPSVIGAALCVNIMSCSQGPLTITITWREGATHDDSKVRSFGHSIKQILQHVAEGSVSADTSCNSIHVTD